MITIYSCTDKKTQGKSMSKDEQIYFRVGSEMKKEFMDIVDSQDKTASKVLYRFVQEYIKKHKEVSKSKGK